MKYIFNRINEHIENDFELAIPQGFSSTSATRQARQRWFSVCIFPLVPLFGLTGIEDQRKLNCPQSAPACSFLRYGQVLFSRKVVTL